MKTGGELSFGEYNFGSRVYIAFTGGIGLPTVIGSRATYIRGNYGGINGGALKQGDQLSIGKPT